MYFFSLVAGLNAALLVFCLSAESSLVFGSEPSDSDALETVETPVTSDEETESDEKKDEANRSA